MLLVTVTTGVRWYDDSVQARALDRPESVTVVPHGGTGAIGQVRWRVLGRSEGERAPAGLAPAGSARLTLQAEARPLNAQGVKELTESKATFRISDQEGHIWSGLADTPSEAQPGTAVRVPITANVPADRLRSVVLEILPSSVYGNRAGPIRVLRFAH